MTINRHTAFFGIITVVVGVVMTLFLPNKLDEQGVEFIRKHEAFSSKPYRDQGGVWTIGYGSTYYPDGTRVTGYDKPLNMMQANYILHHTIIDYEFTVHKNVERDLTQSQYNALVSFAYNVGVNAFERSRLLRRVNEDPTNPHIITEFYRWVYVKGRISKGLLKRREAEIELYYKDPYLFPEREGAVSYFRPDTIPL